MTSVSYSFLLEVESSLLNGGI